MISWGVLWLTCAMLLSCGHNARNSPVAWEVAFGCTQDAENAALVTLRILRGGCAGSTVVYEAEIERGKEVDTPPSLPRGRYGFTAAATDAGGQQLAEVCEERNLPSDESVKLVLASLTRSCETADAGPRADASADASTTMPDAEAGVIGTKCGDSDEDGCDDCSYGAKADPSKDGPEIDGDGKCDCVVFADASVQGQGDGRRWSTAYVSLQAAVDRAAQLSDQCEVWVRQGTYHMYQTSVNDGLRMAREIDLYGGFAGGELAREQRSADAALTIIDGRSQDSVSQRVRHVIIGAAATTIDGFTIVGGDAAGKGDDGKGGGMLNIEVNPILRNLRFRINHAVLGGGAIYSVRANVVIERCVFEENTTPAAGGAIWDDSGVLTLTRSVFRSNQAEDVQFGGAGLYVFNGQATIENALFASNVSTGKGGAVLGESSSVRLTNCTLSRNSASQGGGVMGLNGAMFTVQNSIIYDNQPDAIVGTFAATYSDFEGSMGPGRNIASDPMFADAAGGDYELTEGSPCVDAAHGGRAPSVDLLGRERFDWDVADTGGGTPTFADMGAYELLP